MYMARTIHKSQKSVEIIKHTDASRRHIPTAEFQSVLSEDMQTPIQVAYQRRNPDLDPQLVWRGKDMQDWSALVVQAPPLYIQEKIHPKVLIDDLRRQTEVQEKAGKPQQIDMFADFNGLPSETAKTEFYQHDANWSNRMILGDSLQVMASLAEREGLRGKVQCIYIDPPYGIKFNSNFQWSTTSKDVIDGKVDHITREPEQVKAFRDTWRDGIHTYLTYMRDRLIVARDLLSESGSIFVQISDENIHRVRTVLDEIFGDDNFCREITVSKASSFASKIMSSTADYILWYAKDISKIKYRAVLRETDVFENPNERYICVETANGELIDLTFKQKNGDDPVPAGRLLRIYPTYSQGSSSTSRFDFVFQGNIVQPYGQYGWQTNEIGLNRLARAGRLHKIGKSIGWKSYFDSGRYRPVNTVWTDLRPGGFGETRIYVVQTDTRIVQRCILMTTDPGDLVLDPTCGSGTTAYVSEEWGRRWITIDTSRVALALARARIMGTRFPYYLLKDSRDGQLKESEIARTLASNEPTYGNIRQGFVYERVPRIMLSSIANNAEIDIIWDKFQENMEPVREQFNRMVGKVWEEWEIPREAKKDWPQQAKELHEKWWQMRVARQKEIDASITAKAENEYLYDKPYEDNKKVRVAGPFTVESLSPHRVLGVDENDELIDTVAEGKAGYAPGQSFEQMIIDNLKAAGVQQAHKEDKINFFSLAPWPGYYICAEGRYFEGGEERGRERRAGIFIGPEFGTVSRPDLVAAAREAGDAGFDVLIACAFNYDAQSTEFSKLGAIPVLKARMNADLHMADDLKNTGKGNLFVIFGEPDISILDAKDGQIQVKINGVDVFHPDTGEVRSDGAEGIACWFIDTDYNEESFFVRHAYFLGANDPYSALKTTLKAEINEEAWESLHSDTSRPFDKPASGRIAVKVINHLGDEVMKVFRVSK
jgi:adenine-specific DNA-methyltransferase